MRYALVVVLVLASCGGSDLMLSLEDASSEWAAGWCAVEMACGETVPCRWLGWRDVFLSAYWCRVELPAEWVSECRAALESAGCTDEVPAACQEYVCH